MKCVSQTPLPLFSLQRFFSLFFSSPFLLYFYPFLSLPLSVFLLNLSPSHLFPHSLSSRPPLLSLAILIFHADIMAETDISGWGPVVCTSGSV